jgi:hypothetical protein
MGYLKKCNRCRARAGYQERNQLTMKQIIGVVFLLSVCIFPQPSVAEWEVGLESVAPVGDFEDVAGGGGGLYANFYRPANDNLYYNLYIGALAYGGIEAFGIEVQWYGYPVTLGGTYYLNGIDNDGPFLKANGGVLFKLGTIEFLGEEESESETGSVISVGGGWDFGAVNVAADYNLGNDDWTWFAIKASYRFGR